MKKILAVALFLLIIVLEIFGLYTVLCSISQMHVVSRLLILGGYELAIRSYFLCS